MLAVQETKRLMIATLTNAAGESGKEDKVDKKGTADTSDADKASEGAEKAHKQGDEHGGGTILVGPTMFR